MFFKFWSEKDPTIYFFFKGCLKAIYGKRRWKQSPGAGEEEEEVVGDWTEVGEEKLQSSCQEGMFFRAVLISALCHFLFSSRYASSKQWSQTQK